MHFVPGQLHHGLPVSVEYRQLEVPIREGSVRGCYHIIVLALWNVRRDFPVGCACQPSVSEADRPERRRSSIVDRPAAEREGVQIELDALGRPVPVRYFDHGVGSPNVDRRLPR